MKETLFDNDVAYYICGICGARHENIEDRIACETKCLAARKEAKEKMKLAKYNEEKNDSAKALTEELIKVEKMVKKHLQKYDTYSIPQKFPYLSYIFSGHSMFWF